MQEEEGKPELMPQIDDAMANVSRLRTRYGGKTVPPEKFAIAMAQVSDSRMSEVRGPWVIHFVRPQRYVDGEKQLVLPALQLCYIWNVFGNCRERPDLMAPHLATIERKMKQLAADHDGHLVLVLLKGVCLRNANVINAI